MSANFNALIDKADDPRKSLDQTLLEMREQILAARREVVSGVASEKQLKKKVEELDQEVEKWQRRAELAVRTDDDALAREALLQKRRRGRRARSRRGAAWRTTRGRVRDERSARTHAAQSQRNSSSVRARSRCVQSRSRRVGQGSSRWARAAAARVRSTSSGAWKTRSRPPNTRSSRTAKSTQRSRRPAQPACRPPKWKPNFERSRAARARSPRSRQVRSG